MVSPKNRHVIRILIGDKIEILKYRVRSAHIPISACPHLRRHRIDILSKHSIEVPSCRKMLDERIRFELGEDFYFKNSRIDEIVQHKINDAVFAAKIDRRLSAFVGERVEPGAFSSGHHHA